MLWGAVQIIATTAENRAILVHSEPYQDNPFNRTNYSNLCLDKEKANGKGFQGPSPSWMCFTMETTKGGHLHGLEP